MLSLPTIVSFLDVGSSGGSNLECTRIIVLWEMSEIIFIILWIIRKKRLNSAPFVHTWHSQGLWFYEMGLHSRYSSTKRLPPRFRNWITIFSSSSSSRVLLNGVVGPPMLHGRGLCQGDPLSPQWQCILGTSLYADDAAVFWLPSKKTFKIFLPSFLPLARLSIFAPIFKRAWSSLFIAGRSILMMFLRVFWRNIPLSP